MEEEQNSLMSNPRFAIIAGRRSSGIKIEDISSQQAPGSSHVRVGRSSKDKGKAKMYEGAAFNNGLFSQKTLNILEQKGLSSKDLDKVKVSNVDGNLLGESFANILNGSLEEDKISDVKEGLGFDVESYLEESVLNLMNKPTQGFELMDVEEVMLEMAMFEEFKLKQNHDKP